MQHMRYCIGRKIRVVNPHNTLEGTRIAQFEYLVICDLLLASKLDNLKLCRLGNSDTNNGISSKA